MFQTYISYFTSIANSLNVGFVPIVCTSSLSFFAVFIFKALLPYAVVLSVGLGLCIILHFQRQDRNKKGITTVQRLVSSAVYVVYYLYPSMVEHLLRIFHCTDPIYGAGHDGEEAVGHGAVQVHHPKGHSKHPPGRHRPRLCARSGE